MKLILLAILILSQSICYGQQGSIMKGSERGDMIDSYINHLLQRQGIPGAAIAIVKDNEIIHRKNYGLSNIEHQVPITDKSIFRVYSLTKPIISVGIFQLIENGQVSLDDLVSKYISDLPESWNYIQVKHLLSHSSGLPDMAPIPEFMDLSEEESKKKVFSQELRFKAGERYNYNQTGFWILQKIIESVTGEAMSSFILKNQFNSNKNVFFSSDSRDVILNRATPYFSFSKGTLMLDHPYLQGDYAHALNGLNITMDEFIKWDKHFSEDEFLDLSTKELMWQNFPYTKSDKTFAYGWDKVNVNGNISYGFSGSMCTAYRVFPNKNLSIIFLSNGLDKWYNIGNIMNHIASLVDEDILDINNLAFESLLRASFENDRDNFTLEYHKIKKYPRLMKNDFENHLNDVGYFCLLSLGDNEKAIEIFELNTRLFPNSWNVYDSLADAYERNANNEKAILNYQKALDLNVDQEYKANTLSKIKNLQD